jgi:hypothetical protein
VIVAFIYAVDDTGREHTGTVVNRYSSYTALQRYWLSRYLKPGCYKVYLHHDRNRIYGQADRELTYTKL